MSTYVVKRERITGEHSTIVGLVYYVFITVYCIRGVEDECRRKRFLNVFEATVKMIDE